MQRIPPYQTSVEMAGGQAEIILRDADANHAPDDMDGLLLTGGGDIDPSYFGEEPDPLIRTIDKSRDQLEMALISEAVNRNIPVFGICRGLQLMNVSLGGTLIQDIASHIQSTVLHDDHAHSSRQNLAHAVKIEPDTLLHSILKSDHVEVNSFHHQAIGKLGENLKATAWADDGIVEAIELPDRPFFLAVQWHPEEFWREPSRFGALFERFVEASRKRT